MEAQFGSYQLIRPIGKGGMAEVFLARTQSAGGYPRLVAIKRLIGPYNADKQLVSMLGDEARLSVWLNHPNIVQIFDFGKVGRKYYIAMEYVDGCDLSRIIRRKGKKRGNALPLPTALYTVLQVAEALDFAHCRTDDKGKRLKIIHRDVSPHNVLLSREGGVKLADFGLARAEISVHRSHAGVIRGKFAYMPKEQAQGKTIDHRIDIFAAGVTLYEALTGVRPYSAQNLAQQLYQLEREIPPPSAHVPDLPSEIDELAMQALSPSAGQRYQSAEDLAGDLRHALAQLSTTSKEAKNLATIVANAAGPPNPQDIPQASLMEIAPVPTSLIGTELRAVQQSVARVPESRTSGRDASAPLSSVDTASGDDEPASEPADLDREAEDAPTEIDPPHKGPGVDRVAELASRSARRREAMRDENRPTRKSSGEPPASGPAALRVPGSIPSAPTGQHSYTELTSDSGAPALGHGGGRTVSTGEIPLARNPPTGSQPQLRPAQPTGVSAATLVTIALLAFSLGAVCGWLLRDMRAPRATPHPQQATPSPKAVQLPSAVSSPIAEDAGSQAAAPTADATVGAHAADLADRPPASEPAANGTAADGTQGTLSVASPRPASVLINGKRVGEAPLVLGRPPGPYRVRLLFKDDKQFSETRWVTVKRGAQVLVDFRDSAGAGRIE